MNTVQPDNIFRNAVALVMPLNLDGDISWDCLEALIKYLDPWVTSFVILGSTGENFAFDDECNAVIQKVREISKKPIVIGLRGNSPKIIQKKISWLSPKSLAALWGFMISVPNQEIKPSQETLVNHFNQIAPLFKDKQAILYVNYHRGDALIFPDSIIKIYENNPTIWSGIKWANIYEGWQKQVQSLYGYFENKIDFSLIIGNDPELKELVEKFGFTCIISVIGNIEPEKVGILINHYLGVKRQNDTTIKEIEEYFAAVFKIFSKTGNPQGPKNFLSALKIIKTDKLASPHVRKNLNSGNELLSLHKKYNQ